MIWSEARPAKSRSDFRCQAVPEAGSDTVRDSSAGFSITPTRRTTPGGTLDCQMKKTTAIRLVKHLTEGERRRLILASLQARLNTRSRQHWPRSPNSRSAPMVKPQQLRARWRSTNSEITFPNDEKFDVWLLRAKFLEQFGVGDGSNAS